MSLPVVATWLATGTLACDDISAYRETLVDLVNRAITDAINRVKISIILPKLLENRWLLVETLKNTSYKRAISLVNDFHRRRDIILMEQRSPLMDHGMIQIIDYFQMNNDMFTRFTQIAQQMSKKEKELLAAFEMLQELTNRRLVPNAYAYIEEERRLQGLYNRDKEFQKKVRTLQSNIYRLTRRLTWVQETKHELTRQLQFQIKAKEDFFEDSFLAEQAKKRREVLQLKKISLEKEAVLAETLKAQRTELQKTENEHRLSEKRCRDEKNKLELQLQAIIQKYDSTIGEKKIELFELEKKVNEAKEKVDKCWIIYHKEKKIFESLIGDREREEQRLRKVMIVKFSMNWAASKIQRYWRKWRKRLLRKRSKQKNVKRKSKKPNK